MFTLTLVHWAPALHVHDGTRISTSPDRKSTGTAITWQWRLRGGTSRREVLFSHILPEDLKGKLCGKHNITNYSLKTRDKKKGRRRKKIQEIKNNLVFSRSRLLIDSLGTRYKWWDECELLHDASSEDERNWCHRKGAIVKSTQEEESSCPHVHTSDCASRNEAPRGGTEQSDLWVS